MLRLTILIVAALSVASHVFAQSSPGSFVTDFDPHAHYTLGGVVGERVSANKTGWLLRAPQADPGLLAMFRLRDRQPPPQLVPWAGEFVGKYLISAIQALRLDADPKLKATVAAVVHELIACQADNGYLGPFPANEQLLKHWDLWGHYHIMLALLMWHEQTGDTAALEAARKIADLACQIYLDTDRRPRDAGSTEMNLAIIHSLGRLYRLTKVERYLQLMREIEKDWEQEGDYYRTGLAGVEFYQTPKPRWESLHDVQGLGELYLITGDTRYRRALLHHWQSIRRLDRRNTGGFSSGEQATGTPYEPTAIETCCTIAWMALTVDALRLTGDSIAADELERSTFNGMLGAASFRLLVDIQHTDGRSARSFSPHDRIPGTSRHTRSELLQRECPARPRNALGVGFDAIAERADHQLLRTAGGRLVTGRRDSAARSPGNHLSAGRKSEDFDAGRPATQLPGPDPNPKLVTANPNSLPVARQGGTRRHHCRLDDAAWNVLHDRTSMGAWRQSGAGSRYVLAL